ncbi:DNA polymerase alpha catalytic subunit, Pola1 [Monocercomonoides exilis]|uniref:DNA polymerase alpha catalytic subunit, Pola1 n=1 Tax=Monocercomonoides exilis TaxID=2049356 RepID=UPI00355A58AF|nr:DNA polymerase alpha catalytic subunit, Pola1 [Monocercomonoides exilis]|eukprot:MONOS_5000.1-p1 / transcript=MONOS_5000.1 / gene=MONOS_5000 / organism=Monocercomonoides_exilis_PA203 / gene_product=DNA polymerase alpha catalytic subunit, Pola1 / transcript_product=DNA polymerase alpha catalytic subunit, Pola1 / location=Mono_scaffold00140:87360-92632(+) / protein_length=1624 / sequence_SO=supercontig / SO=protein_coding / is_pseudo=false
MASLRRRQQTSETDEALSELLDTIQGRLRPLDQIEEEEDEISYYELSAEEKYFLRKEYEEEMKERPVRIGSGVDEDGNPLDGIVPRRRAETKKELPPSAVPLHFLRPVSEGGKSISNVDLDAFADQISSTLKQGIEGKTGDQEVDPLAQSMSLEDEPAQVLPVIQPAAPAKRITITTQTKLPMVKSESSLSSSMPLTSSQGGATDDNAETMMEPGSNMMDEDEEEDIFNPKPQQAASFSASSAHAVLERGAKENKTLFYLLDAQEVRGREGLLFLFGKVVDPLTQRTVSGSIRVEGIRRELYVLPRQTALSMETGEDEPVEEAAVEAEIRSRLGSLAKESVLRWVQRRFPFDGVDEAPEEGRYLRLNVPAHSDIEKMPKSGNTYSYIFGTERKLTEIFLVAQQIMGPCWLTVANIGPKIREAHLLNTYCSHQYRVSNPAFIEVLKENIPPPPLLRALTLSVQTSINSATKQQEVVVVSAHVNDQVVPDGHTDQSSVSLGKGVAGLDANELLEPPPQHLYPLFSLICPVGEDNTPLPHDIAQVASRSAKEQNERNQTRYKAAGVAVGVSDSHLEDYKLYVEPNETALLSHLAVLISQHDPDVLVGFNLIHDILGVFIQRLDHQRSAARRAANTRTGSLGMQNEKLIEETMKKFGRLKRAKFPFVGGNIDFAVQFATAGRLLCDVAISAKEFRRERNYSLPTLSETVLSKNVEEYEGSLVKASCLSSMDVMRMIKHTERLSQISFEMMLALNVVSLTKQLANITGTLWARVLIGGRAERVENLLLHRFAADRTIILPDKNTRRTANTGSEQTEGVRGHEGDEQKGEEADEMDERGKNVKGKSILSKLSKARKVVTQKKPRGNGANEEEAEEIDVADADEIGDRDEDEIEDGTGGDGMLTLEDATRKMTLSNQPEAKKQAQPQESKRARRKKAAYKGGFVLDAERGFYNNYILVLDFNSLYPSIIREKNLCHTTLPRGQYSEEDMSSITIRPVEGVLPKIVADLIEERKKVRKQMALLKHSREIALQKKAEIASLDTMQLAFKLVANSMYGCLGFESGRFYAKRLAQTITWNGRLLLQEAVKTVTNERYHVIYGDTDSLMIDTHSTSVKQVIEIGNRLSALVNKNRHFLHIDIDGIFSAMLLLRKKKYAAMKLVTDLETTITNPETARFEMEYRGLEIVRRDWCPITREAEKEVLRILLGDNGTSRHEQRDKQQSHRINSTRPASMMLDTRDEKEGEKGEGGEEEEEISEMQLAEQMADSVCGKIDDYLRRLSNRLRTGEWNIKEFEITKSIFKRPEEYPDPKGQPHVVVALELQRLKKTVRPGDAIPYIICKGPENWAQRAHHPSLVAQTGAEAFKLQQQMDIEGEEYEVDPSSSSEQSGLKHKYEPDLDWYFAQQIHPAILRLTECVDGMDGVRIAECLGMDTTKYRETQHATGWRSQFVSTDLLGMETRFRSCVPLTMRCMLCKDIISLPPLASSAEEAQQKEFSLRCPHCGEGEVEMPQLRMAAQLFLRRIAAQHFNSPIVCDDPLCTAAQGALNLRSNTCIDKSCRGQIKQLHDAEAHYIQLLYLREVLTPTPYKHPSYGHLVPHVNHDKDQLEDVLSLINEAISHCTFGKVNLGVLFSQA